MTVYNVKEGSVSVRRIASASSNVVNIIPTGGKIYVIDEEAGWLRTVSGYYVFKTDNLELDNPLQTTTQNTNQRNVLLANTSTLRAAAGTQALTAADVSVPGNYQQLDTGATGYGQVKTAEQIQAEKASRQAEADKAASSNQKTNIYNQDKTLTEKTKGKLVEVQKIVKWNEDGTPARDEDGNYVLIDAPTNVSGNDKQNKIVQVVEDRGIKYAIFQSADGGQYLAPTDTSRVRESDDAPSSTFNSNNYSKEVEEKTLSVLDQLASLGTTIISAYTSMKDLTVEDARTVFGMPYQFMPIVDPRTEKGEETSAFNKFGRKYQEKIISRAPILYMQAGLPIFLKGYSDKAKAGMLEALAGQFENLENGTLKKIIGDQNSQYYSFDERTSQYFKAVNTACIALAHLLEIDAVQIPTIGEENDEDTMGDVISTFLNPKSLGKINWALRTKHSLGWYKGAVAFYINSDTQIQESFTNTTRQSELAGKINSLGDRAAEAAFLMGGIAGALDDRGYSPVAQLAGFQQTWNDEAGYGSAPGILGSIGQNIEHFIAGGKMIFPEIWHDSQFGRSYNINIKLDSPDTDRVSIYLNILVPLAHILGFVLPRYAGNNMYVNPYLVRCFYKSAFHIDMGIITSCNVTKGDAGSWNNDGLPCHVNVDLTIKDLYSSLAQASGDGSNTLISNAAQLEYLANLAGVNILPISFSRAIELWWALNGVNRMKQNLVGGFTDMVQSLYKTYHNIFSISRHSI